MLTPMLLHGSEPHFPLRSYMHRHRSPHCNAVLQQSELNAANCGLAQLTIDPYVH